MTSPYGWGITPKQPNQTSQPSQSNQTAGYSKKSQEQGQGRPTPQYGFGGQTQGQGSSQGQSAPQYGFGGQNQSQTSPQYGFGGQSQTQEQPSPQYGFGGQNQQQYQAQEQPAQQYGFAQQPKQGAPQNDMPYGFNGAQQSVSQPYGQYQQGISVQSPQRGYYPPMQEQFDNNDKYNTKAVLGFIFTFLFWPAGLVLSILGRNEIKKNGGKGKGFTTASFVLCGISIVSTLVVIIMLSTGLLNLGAGRSTLKDGQAGGYSTSKSTSGWEFSGKEGNDSKGSIGDSGISKEKIGGSTPSGNASNPVTTGKDKNKYATVKDWYEKSNDAKTNIHMLGATYAPDGEETAFEGTDTLVEKLTIKGLTADNASGNFGESVKTDYGNIAAVMKEQVSGSAKLHLIVQNENGEVFIDQTY